MRNSNGTRRAVVIDGAVEVAGGVPLVSWNALSERLGQLSKRVLNGFGMSVITDERRYAVIGGTPSGILIRDGELFVRNGQSVDAFQLGSDFRALSMTRQGRLAWQNRVILSGRGFMNAVFREDEFLFKEGDTVDIDGDGILDPGNTVFFIPGGPGSMTFTEDGVVWVRAQLDTVSMGQPWSLLAVGDVFGLLYCTSLQANSTGRGAAIRAVGSNVLGQNDLRLRCVDLPLNSFGYFLCSVDQGFVAGAGGSQGDLCVTGAVGRFNAQAMSSGSVGAIEIAVDWLNLPGPTGSVSASIGDRWSSCCGYRDANPSVTSNFSNGVEVPVL